MGFISTIHSAATAATLWVLATPIRRINRSRQVLAVCLASLKKGYLNLCFGKETYFMLMPFTLAQKRQTE